MTGYQYQYFDSYCQPRYDSNPEILLLEKIMNVLSRCHVEQLRICSIGTISWIGLPHYAIRSQSNVFFCRQRKYTVLSFFLDKNHFSLSYQKNLLSDGNQKGINWMIFSFQKKLLNLLPSLQRVHTEIIAEIFIKRFVKEFKWKKFKFASKRLKVDSIQWIAYL